MPYRLDTYKKWYEIDKYSKVGFIALKEIESDKAFGIAIVQAEKLNSYKGLPKS